MSTSLVKEVSPDNQVLGDKVLEFLFNTLAIDQEWSLRDKTGFIWWPHRLPQRVWFEPLWTEDGSAYIRVHAETLVFRNVPDAIETADRLNALNKYPTMNAFIWNRNTRRISCHSCAYVSDQTFGWLKGFLASAMGLQIVEAHAIGTESEARLFNAEPDESNHPYSGKRNLPDDMLTVIENGFAPAGNRPLGFTETDFKPVLEMKPKPPWVLATAGEWGLTAEFAFDGAEPAAAQFLGLVEDSGETTLLHVVANEQHPRLGSGLLLRLILPVTFHQQEAITKAHQINLAETHEHTLSYFMGAWRSASQFEVSTSVAGGVDGSARLVADRLRRPQDIARIAEFISRSTSTYLCFMTFLPAMILRSTSALEPFVWSTAVRSRWVKQHLSWN